MKEYAAGKKPSATLAEKIRDLTGKPIVIAGDVTVNGDSITIADGPVVS